MSKMRMSEFQTAGFARVALGNWKAIKIPRIKVERVHC